MNGTAIEKGFILTARKFRDNAIMTSKPPLFAKLWMWMLLNARYKDDPVNGLKRGQFFTSIDLIRDAMTYKIGYRRIRPTRKEIRDAYKYFTKVHMIVTMKVTHGMIITICNYGLYQDASNYEGHNEGHTDVTDIKKKGLKKERTKETYVLFFDDFWKNYPSRNGKKLEKTETLKKYCTLTEADLPICNQAVVNYANSETIQRGIGIRDPKRFLKDDYWREWIEPEKKEVFKDGAITDPIKACMLEEGLL